MNKTRKRLIEAAEAEFAEKGFYGASIRNITNRAESNVASVSYHFGSKDELLLSMIRHRIEPINEKRFTRLDKALKESDGKPLKVRELVDILIRPMIEAMNEDKSRATFMRAIARAISEQTELTQVLQKEVFAKVISVFGMELARTLQGNSPELIKQCFTYIIVCTSGIMHQQQRAQAMQAGPGFPNAENTITFIAGGIDALVASHNSPAT
ncbi:TetR/AcrR family transcriptional regulator [Pelagicoccus albus]|uniref:TetR/AcrR family transcriptional regulator n=1 Tax=Pelagicoccus albus TaxID=415222 RepID=A0A7X1B4N4_9BACT|nr:TetR/AcrR family transcriptional regulator [Pelagicoccus albus]MBC2605349.1 TetR/AcrR family transcriptional regulator [Pelagicoccus albus]